jgi:aspartate aminotransferase-like enzyme
MARATWAWAEASGLRIIAAEGSRSPTVSCIVLPEGRTGPEVVNLMAERGWTIATGYGQLKESTVRIGHMGEHTVAHVEEVLAELGDVLG